MARKRADKMPATRASKTLRVKSAKADDVPMRFMMPRPEYDELARQGRRLGLSNSSYAKMLVMEQVAERKGGSK
jgi:hypothetical protein